VTSHALHKFVGGAILTRKISGQPVALWKTQSQSKLRNYNTAGAMAQGWLQCGSYQVYPWTISGYESCVVVKGEGGLFVTFDMGYAVKESVNCQHIFIR